MMMFYHAGRQAPTCYYRGLSSMHIQIWKRQRPGQNPNQESRIRYKILINSRTCAWGRWRRERGEAGEERKMFISMTVPGYFYRPRAGQGRNERTDELTNERFLIQLRPWINQRWVCCASLGRREEEEKKRSALSRTTRTARHGTAKSQQNI